MKITVELDDFWMDGEESLSEELKHYVSIQVKKEIWESIKELATKTVTDIVREDVEKTMLAEGKKIVSTIIETKKIKAPSSSIADDDGMCTLEDYIKYEFENKSGWNSPFSKIKDLAKKFGDEMKSRYDLMFASQIVSRMNENGLLKEDVAKRLIEKEGE